MKSWSEAEIQRVRSLAGEFLTAEETALVLGDRSVGAVRYIAGRHKIAFAGHEGGHLRRRLNEGARLIVEDIPKIGRRWTTASRTGESFNAQQCEAYCRLGLMIEREGVWQQPLFLRLGA